MGANNSYEQEQEQSRFDEVELAICVLNKDVLNGLKKQDAYLGGGRGDFLIHVAIKRYFKRLPNPLTDDERNILDRAVKILTVNPYARDLHYNNVFDLFFLCWDLEGYLTNKKLFYKSISHLVKSIKERFKNYSEILLELIASSHYLFPIDVENSYRLFYNMLYDGLEEEGFAQLCCKAFDTKQDIFFAILRLELDYFRSFLTPTSQLWTLVKQSVLANTDEPHLDLLGCFLKLDLLSDMLQSLMMDEKAIRFYPIYVREAFERLISGSPTVLHPLLEKMKAFFQESEHYPLLVRFLKHLELIKYELSDEDTKKRFYKPVLEDLLWQEAAVSNCAAIYLSEKLELQPENKTKECLGALVLRAMAVENTLKKYRAHTQYDIPFRSSLFCLAIDKSLPVIQLACQSFFDEIQGKDQDDQTREEVALLNFCAEELLLSSLSMSPIINRSGTGPS